MGGSLFEALFGLYSLQNDISANTIAALKENESGTVRGTNLCGLPGVRQGTPVRLANNAAHKPLAAWPYDAEFPADWVTFPLTSCILSHYAMGT